MGSWAYVIPTITLASNFNLKPNENTLNSRGDALWIAEDALWRAEDALWIAEDAPWIAEDAPWIAEDAPWIAEDDPGIAEDAPWRAEGCSMAGDRILARVVQRAVLSQGWHTPILLAWLKQEDHWISGLIW